MTENDNSSRGGYVVFVEGITDWDRYLNEYLPTVAETIDDHAGTVIVGSTDPDVVEGEWTHDMTVVVEFPSVEAARAWYGDPAYEEVKPIRFEACEYAHALITPEFAPEDLPG